MKRYIIICLIGVCTFVSCVMTMKEQMEIAVKEHMQEYNKKEGMQSKFEALKTVSYKDYKNADTAYVAKVYVVSTSWYIGGSRVYNTNDTLNIYFDKDLHVLRMTEKIKK